MNMQHQALRRIQSTWALENGSCDRKLFWQYVLESHGDWLLGLGNELWVWIRLGNFHFGVGSQIVSDQMYNLSSGQLQNCHKAA